MSKTKKAKKILLIVFILLLLGATVTFAVFKALFPGMAFVGSAPITTLSTSVDRFSYQPEKIDQGTVYHYVKSNMDNSKPAEVIVFVRSVDHLEVFKIYPGASAAYFVTADFDWNIFSPKTLDGYEISSNLKKKLVLHGSWSKEGNSYEYSDGKSTYSVPIGQYPVHNFNFDFTSLNFSFRHLRNPESNFEIGVQYPSFNPFTFIHFVYTGKASVRYLSDEPYNQKPCRKYEISGEGIRNKRGFIWVNKEGGYFENIEIPLSDNPSWNSFKLTLSGTEKMSAEEWNTYIASQTKNYFARRK